jgi:hypothetical protein
MSRGFFCLNAHRRRHGDHDSRIGRGITSGEQQTSTKQNAATSLAKFMQRISIMNLT